MVKYPAYGVNGRPTNIEDIIVDEIASEYNKNDYILDLVEYYDDDLAYFTDLLYADGVENESLEMPEDMDYYGDGLDTINAIFTNSSNGFVYNYPYEIAYIMCGDNWQDKLADAEYNDEQEVIDAFYDMAKVSLDQAFIQYTGEELKKMIKNYE